MLHAVYQEVSCEILFVTGMNVQVQQYLLEISF